jgi:hypothetical protein
LTKNTWHPIWHQTFTMPLAYYQVFPIPEIRSPHSLSFSLRTIGRALPQSQFGDLGMFPASLAAEQQAPEGSLHF